MTLIEAMIFGVWIVLICAGSMVGRFFGSWAMGALLGLLAGPGLFFVLRGLLEAWSWLFPVRPRCARGACGQDDYRLADLNPGSARYVCRCDDEYVREGIAGGEECFGRVVDGELQPYRVRRALRWRPDPRAPGAPFR